MPSFVFHFHKNMENDIQFVFPFHKGIKKRITETDQDSQNEWSYHKYGLHIIQEQVRVKSLEVFRCAVVTWTPRIRCLENK